MYKIIAIDLDGTLLNDSKELTQDNIEVLNRVYTEKNIIPVIVTGRPYICAKYIASKVGECLSQYIVSSNGSLIKDDRNNVEINNETISNTDTLKIMNIAEKYNFKWSIDIGQTLLKSPGKVDEDTYKTIGQPYEIKENIIQYLKQNNTQSYVITYTADKDKLIEAIKELEKIDGIKASEICEYNVKSANGSRSGTYIDIMKKDCNKKNGIKHLATYLGITKEEIMVIGDGGNDIPMFEAAGFKVAMQNGLDAIKQKADYITDTNNNSGVAKAIEKLILNK